jgi:peptidoglycan lytic transglycosylase
MARCFGLLLCLVVALGLGGCVTSSPTEPAITEPSPEPGNASTPGTAAAPVPAPHRATAVTPETAPTPKTMTGRASWYGEPHHGRLTASGEPFDMNALTAAHRSLPFGTRLRVVNLKNDRVVEVRINDRGPSTSGRVLDLSYAAARALGAVGTGVIPVRMTVLSTN